MRSFLGVLVSICMAIVASLAFSGQALATHGVHDVGCDQYGDNHVPGIFDFQIDTPLSQQENAVSNVVGSGYFCGPFLGETPGDGDYTLSNHADISLPPGVEMTDTGTVDDFRYAGNASVNVIRRFADGTPQISYNVASSVYTYPKAECENQRDNNVVGDTPQGEIVACLWAFNSIGQAWNWATRDLSSGQLSLTIGPMFINYDQPDQRRAGLTHVDLELCAYFGVVAPDEGCGEEGIDEPMMRNGDASAPDCNGGAGPEGIHTIVGTAWAPPRPFHR